MLINWPRARIERLVALLVGLAAAAVAVELLRPIRTGAVGFDTAASVLHFDRIVAGRHLEAFVTATPKPLLTFVDGILMAFTGDWRSVSWATIVAFAVAVSGAAWLAVRLDGWVAGGAAALLVVSSPRLLGDLAIAYALPFAAVLWVAAAAAGSGSRPRPVLAGIALAGATLARLETVAIVGTALAVVAIATLGRRAGRPLDRSWWWLLVALAAFPIMAIHDWLLTGDPLFWMSVSATFSRQAPDAVLSAPEVIRLLVVRFGTEPWIVGLAVVGAAGLVGLRRYPVLVGLVGSTVGIAAFLVVLALRGTYVSDRYLGAIDLGLRLAAAFGVAVVARTVTSALRRRWPAADDAGGSPGASRGAAAAGAGLALLVTVGAAWPLGFAQPAVRRAAATARGEADHLVAVLPVLRCAIGSIPGGVPMPPPSTTLAPTAPSDVVMLGPTLLRPRLAHDLGLPVGLVGGIPASSLAPGPGFLPGGLIVFHDRASDRPAEAFAVLEIDRRTTIGAVTLWPLLADPARGIWVVGVERAGRPAVPTTCAGAIGT